MFLSEKKFGLAIRFTCRALDQISPSIIYLVIFTAGSDSAQRNHNILSHDHTAVSHVTYHMQYGLW